MVKCKHKIVFVLVVMLSCVTAGLTACSAFGTGASNEEKESIYNAIVQSEEALFSIGVIPATLLNTDKKNIEVLSEAQTQELLTEKKAGFSNCFNERLEYTYKEQTEISITAAKERAEYMKQAGNIDVGDSGEGLDTVDITVDAGVLSCDLRSVSVNEDGATASAVIIAWSKSIYFDKTTKEYYTWLTFSEFDNEYHFVKRDDHWVVDSADGDQLFAPDGYDYRKGTYTTFEEAVTAAQKIVPSEENPF
ncbi:MAG TPA: hypothetical protein PKD52_03045 [Clostridiales bacterium]|nr:hypothetical protein [Clostridiales bacterium]